MKTAIPGIVIGAIVIGVGIYYASYRSPVATTPPLSLSTTTLQTLRDPLLITTVEKKEIKNEREYTSSLPVIIGAPTLSIAISEYINETNKEFNEMEYPTPRNNERMYEMVYRFEVIRNDAEYTTLVINSYMFTGGARGLPTFRIFTYNRVTDSFVSHDNILAQYAKTNLENDVYNFIIKKYASNSNDRILFEDAIVREGVRDVINTVGNVGIGIQGVYVRFPVYSIAPYSTGEIIVEL